MSQYISYSLPAAESFPSLYNFFFELRANALPEMKLRELPEDKANSPQLNHTAIFNAAKELKLIDKYDEDANTPTAGFLTTENDDIFKLLYELNEAKKIIENSKNEVSWLDSTQSITYDDTTIPKYQSLSTILKSYVDGNGLKHWVDPKYERGTNSYFDIALLFTYFLLKRDCCKDNIIPFFNKCLSYVGIQINSDVVKSVLYNFNWTDKGKTIDNRFNRNDKGERVDNTGKKYVRLGNKATILFGAVILVISKYLNKFDANNEDMHKAFGRLYDFFNTVMEDEITAQETIDQVRRNLYEQICVFNPRTIGCADVMLHDVYVQPKFKKGIMKNVSPVEELKKARSASSSIIVSPTGFGKSVYLQMLALCTLRDVYDGSVRDAKFQAIRKGIGIPDDMFTIIVPARMFTILFEDEEYKQYTNDFVSLFFRALYKLHGTRNFFLHETDIRDITCKPDKEITNTALYKYLKHLARRGRLLLILDSFDEIAPGEKRAAYLKTIENFRKDFCSIDGGAHILAATRNMSQSTMSAFKAVLKAQDDSYEICPLDENQRKEIIENWARQKNDDNLNDVEKDIRTIEDNHIYRELASTPYMLSVIYWELSRENIGEIIKSFSATLEQKIMNNVHNEAPQLMMLITTVNRQILGELALDTVMNKNPIISEADIRSKLNAATNGCYFNFPEEKEQCLSRLFNIVVAEAGFIVPADGNDNAFQFINETVRYYYAASRFSAFIDSEENYAAYKTALDGLTPESFAKLFALLLSISTLCPSINTYSRLAFELAFRNIDPEKPEQDAEIVTAIADILLKNYGVNLITGYGGTDAPLISRIQRMFVSRLLTAPSEIRKVLSAGEAEKLFSSEVWKNNESFFPKDIIRRVKADTPCTL